jgi:hypothetical protein
MNQEHQASKPPPLSPVVAADVPGRDCRRPLPPMAGKSRFAYLKQNRSGGKTTTGIKSQRTGDMQPKESEKESGKIIQKLRPHLRPE